MQNFDRQWPVLVKSVLREHKGTPSKSKTKLITVKDTLLCFRKGLLTFFLFLFLFFLVRLTLRFVLPSSFVIFLLILAVLLLLVFIVFLIRTLLLLWLVLSLFCINTAVLLALFSLMVRCHELLSTLLGEFDCIIEVHQATCHVCKHVVPWGPDKWQRSPSEQPPPRQPSPPPRHTPGRHGGQAAMMRNIGNKHCRGALGYSGST
ncbi:hypothetical protein E2C01_010071 [Portunus trituberculatus]|uniref:Uncharacterized protein n=1 Tax=Portunus trituberculatus TaxID=210409 RepID=A0A5B7D7N4_PORTR|nr:hypothetical protein [Portunus trituberculatus]